jgi:hypothetical protein
MLVILGLTVQENKVCMLAILLFTPHQPSTSLSSPICLSLAAAAAAPCCCCCCTLLQAALQQLSQHHPVVVRHIDPGMYARIHALPLKKALLVVKALDETGACWMVISAQSLRAWK